MSLKPVTEQKTYLNIQGKVEENNVCFRKTVPEGTPGAKLRKYETSDGKTGEKWELWYKEVGGTITNVHFFEGDYGKNLIITLDAGLDEPVELSLGVATRYGEDVLKKLPNIDFNKQVILTPYGFEPEGKIRQGVSIVQRDCGWKDDKVTGAFYDPEKKKNLLGMPESGDIDDNEDLKIYFMQARKHMIQYAEKEILPQFEGVTAEVVAEDEEF
jgi:hypothetical protein